MHNEPADARAFSAWERIAIFVASAVLVVAAGTIVFRLNLDDANDQLAARAEAVHQRVSHAMSGGDAVLASLASLYQASEFLGSTELTSIAQQLQEQYPYIVAIAYLTAVSNQEREDFEAGMRQLGYTRFQIRNPPTEGKRGSVAGARQHYLAVSFLEPLDPLSARLIGVDALQDATTSRAILDAIDGGEIEAAASTLFTGGRSGYLLAKATYFGHYAPSSTEGRRQQVSGAFVLVLDVSQMLADIQTDHPDVGIGMTRTTSKRPGSSSIVFKRRGPKQPAGIAGLMPLMHARYVLDRHQGQLTLDVSIHPSGELVNLWSAVLVMALAAVLSASLVWALRNRRIARVRDRASQEAIFHEKERAQVTLQSIGDGVVTTDKQWRIQYMNPVAEQMTGWSGEAACGRLLTEVVNLVYEDTRQPVLEPNASDIAPLEHDRDVLLVRADGLVIAVDHTASRLRDRDGAAIGAVLVIRDVSRERELANELAYQASHDPLTGLPNRRQFESRLTESQESSRTHGHSHALCYLDLDQFKLVNDTCGHLAGDQMLKQIATVLHAELRDRDLLARLGGDEFGVLLTNCPLGRATEIAERLRNQLANFRFHWGGKIFEASASIGVVPIERNSGTLGDLQTAADLACYAAKDRGRNCVHVYEPGDQVIARHHGEMKWHARIKSALEESRFALYWQTMVALDPALEPAEMREFLVRMVSPTGEVVPPMSFIPAAERYALMTEIDRWVIDHAFEAIRNSGIELGSSLFNINLSGQSVGDPGVAGFIAQRLDEHDVPGSVVCFEITETAAVSNFNQAVSFIENLKERGCRFALDDFGAGLSSFGYLKHLPVDFLKIDGQFVKDITSDPVDFAMVKSIGGIGRVLNIHTVAEMVEDEKTLQMLRTIGVDYAQGFHIGKPEPVYAAVAKAQAARVVARQKPRLERVV